MTARTPKGEKNRFPGRCRNCSYIARAKSLLSSANDCGPGGCVTTSDFSGIAEQLAAQRRRRRTRRRPLQPRVRRARYRPGTWFTELTGDMVDSFAQDGG